jgi:hypothetical protein
MMLLMPERGEETIMMLLPELAGCWSPVELLPQGEYKGGWMELLVQGAFRRRAARPG